MQLALVGQHLHVSKTAVVIDADVSELPADSRARQASIPVDAMADPLDAPQSFRVQVQELAGTLALVAAHQRAGLKGAKALESEPYQHRRDGRAGHAETGRDLGTAQPSSTQPLDPPLP